MQHNTSHLPPREGRVVEPIRCGKHAYEWTCLELGASRIAGGGHGVFAKSDIPMGAMIPILGKKVAMFEEIPHEASHGWSGKCAHSSNLDGHPSIHPHKGVGCFGLSIAMMVNEEVSHRPPNCHFMHDCLTTTRHIAKGEELLTSYGKEYPRKKYGGYVNDNPHFGEDADPAFDEMVLPDPEPVIGKWLEVLHDECLREHPHQYAYKRDVIDLTLDENA
jgi:hypothetical protein